MASLRWALAELAEVQDGAEHVGDAPCPLRHQLRHLLELEGEDGRGFSISLPSLGTKTLQSKVTHAFN